MLFLSRFRPLRLSKSPVCFSERRHFMLVEQMQVGPMAVFAYIVGCETEKEALVIDPAGSE